MRCACINRRVPTEHDVNFANIRNISSQDVRPFGGCRLALTHSLLLALPCVKCHAVEDTSAVCKNMP